MVVRHERRVVEEEVPVRPSSDITTVDKVGDGRCVGHEADRPGVLATRLLPTPLREPDRGQDVVQRNLPRHRQDLRVGRETPPGETETGFQFFKCTPILHVPVFTLVRSGARYVVTEEWCGRTK